MSMRSRLVGLRRTLREDGGFRAFLKHTGWLSGAGAIIIVLAAVQGILTARMLGVALWGMLGVAMGFSRVISLLLSFRMQEFVVKWVTQLGGDGSARASTAFKLALAGDAGTAVLSFVVVELLAGWGASVFAKSPDYVWVFRFVALIIIFQAGQETLLGMMHVNRDFRLQGFVQTGVQVASVCAMAAVYVADGGLLGVVLVQVGAAALTSALMWTFGLRAAYAVLPRGWAHQKIVRFGELGREMMRFAILGNFRGTLHTIMSDGDLLILGFLRNPTEVGYYKLARALGQLADLLNGPLVSTSYPEFSEAAATGAWGDFRSVIRRGTKVAALWLIPVSLGLVVFAKPLIGKLYGPSFEPAAAALAILLVGIVVDGVFYWGGIALLSLGQPGYLAAISVWTTSAKYALAFLLVPVGGYLALAAIQSSVVIGMNVATTRRALQSLKKREAVADG